MTLQQLEYILAVDKYRHFAHAAEFCRVTQPTLSMMIQKLENELDVKLFDRNFTPVRPTAVGCKVLEQARKAVREVSLIKDIVQEEKKAFGGTFRLSVLPTIAPYLLPRFFSQLMEKYPQLDIRVSEMKTKECLTSLYDGEIDAAIIASEVEDKSLECITLYYEQFFGYVSTQEPIFTNEMIRSSDISGKRLWLLDEGHCFRDQLMRFCQLEAVKLHQDTYRLGSMETFMRMVESGNGITFIPELALQQLDEHQRSLVRPFAVPRPARRICLLARKDFVRRTVLDLLVESIQKAVPAEMLKLAATAKVV